MRHFNIARVSTLAVLAASVLINACGGDSTGPTPPPPPPVVTVTSVTVYGGPLSLLPGATRQPDSVRVGYSDNSTKLVALSAVSWSSLAPAVATVNTVGQVTGVNPGDAQINASYSGVIGKLEVTVMKPAPTVIGIIVGAQSPITVPASVQYQCVKKFSDNTLVPTDGCFWSSSDPTVGSISAAGILSALKAGTTQVCATWGAFTGCTSVTVLPDPTHNWWSSLSDAVREYLLRMVVDIFGTARLNQSTVTVWAQPGFAVGDLQAAFDFWKPVPGIPTFVFASDSAGADVHVVWDSSITNPVVCGGESIRYTSDGAISGALLSYATRADCQGDALYKKMRLAHGFGHVLGLLAHTTAGTDVMSSPDMRWVLSSLLVDVLKAIYSVPPRTFP